MSLAPWRTSLTSLPIRKENGEPKNKKKNVSNNNFYILILLVLLTFDLHAMEINVNTMFTFLLRSEGDL